MDYLNDVVFEDIDTPIETAKKTLFLWVGTNELKSRLAKIGIEYTLNVKGLNTYYILRGAKIGTLKIKL